MILAIMSRKLRFGAQNAFVIHAGIHPRPVLMPTGVTLMNIDPSAKIDPLAKIHESVVIGPYTIVEKDVSIGEGTVIESSVRIHEGTTIGKNNRIHHNSVLGAIPQDRGFDPSVKTRLLIGDGNTIREGAHISRSSSPDTVTTIGNQNYLMGNVHMGHDCMIGNHNMISHGSAMAGHVKLGSHIFLMGMVGVQTFCHLGDYVMVGALSLVTRDIPPFTTAEGIPAKVSGINSVGLRRQGFSNEKRIAIREAMEVLYHSDLLLPQAINELKNMSLQTEELAYLISFLESADRGITEHREHTRH